MQRPAGNGEQTEVVDVVPFLGVARSIAVSGTSANQALTTGVRRISIVAAGCDMAFKLGGSGVVAATTDHVLLTGERIEFCVRSTEAYIAAIALSGSGTLRVSELADA